VLFQKQWAFRNGGFPPCSLELVAQWQKNQLIADLDAQSLLIQRVPYAMECM